MKKEIILHIGSGKTGSTSIQKSLFANKNNFENIINYPLILDRKDNQIFRFAFCQLNNTPSNIRSQYKDDEKGFLDFQNSIKKSFEKLVKLSNAVIVSSEFLFLSQEEEIKKIHDYLKDLGFNSFKIIVYIRDPADYYLSVAQQALKTKSSISYPESFYYDFRKGILLWEKHFSNINVRLFKKELLIEQDVVKDFCSIIKGYGYPLNFVNFKRINETLSSEITQVMQDIYSKAPNELVHNKKEALRKFIILLTKKYSNIGSKPILKNEIKNFIYSRFYNDLNWLNNEFNYNLTFHENTYQLNEIKDFKDIVTSFDISLYEKILKNEELNIQTFFNELNI